MAMPVEKIEFTKHALEKTIKRNIDPKLAQLIRQMGYSQPSLKNPNLTEYYGRDCTNRWIRLVVDEKKGKMVTLVAVSIHQLPKQLHPQLTKAEQAKVKRRAKERARESAVLKMGEYRVFK